MSDERRHSSVNLDELERQLREASRARMRAQSAVDNLSTTAGQRVGSAQGAPQAGLNAGAGPSSAPMQPSLPLSPAPAPAPAPAYGSQSASSPPSAPSSAGMRPLQSGRPQPTQSQFGREPAPAAPLPIPPREPQSLYSPPPRTRETSSAYNPVSEPAFSSRPVETAVPEAPLLKSDRMGDVYPPIPEQPVVQDQFYSAAAYEEPAELAYDQFTEDQFPRIEHRRRSGGAVKAVIWLVVIAILGGGLYLAFPILQRLVLPNVQTAKAPPLIKPDTTPVKVQPDIQQQADNAAAPQDIFTKHANEDPKSAQMAQGAEQPLDLNIATKDAQQTLSNGKPVIVPLVPGTGEPRLVRTVTVRADGTIIPEKSDPDLVAKAMPPVPKAPVPQIAPPLNAAAGSLPPLPTSPVAESPDFVFEGPIPLPPEHAADNDTEINLPLDAITTPMPSPPANASPAPQSVETPTPASPATPAAAQPGKDYAVQFGAPETEAKANELKSRVDSQFGVVLANGSMAIVKGDSNGKPVFRVRAVGYSRDEASSVCQQVTAAGGQCFVSKNN